MHGDDFQTSLLSFDGFTLRNGDDQPVPSPDAETNLVAGPVALRTPVREHDEPLDTDVDVVFVIFDCKAGCDHEAFDFTRGLPLRGWH